MAMMLFIMIAAVLIPIQTIKLINLVNSHSRVYRSEPDPSVCRDCTTADRT